MKVLKYFVVLVMVCSLISCGGGVSKQPANAQGFAVIENEIKDKFGQDAYYTDLSISYDNSLGNLIGVTVTESPESLKMGQWNLMRGSWKQNSEIFLEVPEGKQATDFMFQLDDKINLSKLGELVEMSIKQLIAEKNIKNPTLHMAFVDFPKNGDMSKTKYYVMLEPKNGGTTFKFRYTIEGELIEMDY